MHREVLDQMENVLSAARTPPVYTAASASAWAHLAGCEACRGELAAMKAQAQGIRSLRTPKEFEDLEPRPGFYARVMERIEAEGPVSIWNLFMESPFGRRIAVASFALALLLGVYLISSERTATDPILADANAEMNARAAALQRGGQSELPAGDIQVVQDLSTGQITIQGTFDGVFDVDPNQLQQMRMGSTARSANFTEPASDDAELSNFMTYREQ